MSEKGKTKAKSSIKAVLFDMDGTLVDSEELNTECFIESFRSHNIKLKEEDFSFLVGKPSDFVMLSLGEKYGLKGEQVESIIKEKRRIYMNRFGEVNLRKHAYDLVSEFSNHFTLALVTSSSKKYADKVLSKFPEKTFEAVITLEDVKNPKPDPEGYLRALSLFDLKKEDCLVIEDTEIGVAAAKRAGMHVIACPTNETKNHDFSSADLVVDSLDKITIKKIMEMGEKNG